MREGERWCIPLTYPEEGLVVHAVGGGVLVEEGGVEEANATKTTLPCGTHEMRARNVASGAERQPSTIAEYDR